VELRNGHRNRDLIQELFETVALKGDGESGCFKEMFNAVR
jgi:hypothetical protein